MKTFAHLSLVALLALGTVASAHAIERHTKASGPQGSSTTVTGPNVQSGSVDDSRKP